MAYVPAMRLNSADRRRVAALRKRAAHLSARVAASPRRLTYDEIELDALLWVLSVVAPDEQENET